MGSIQLSSIESVHLIHVKTEPVDVNAIKLLHIQRDFEDENVDALPVLAYDFDDVNMLKQEPSVDYTLELPAEEIGTRRIKRKIEETAQVTKKEKKPKIDEGLVQIKIEDESVEVVTISVDLNPLKETNEAGKSQKSRSTRVKNGKLSDKETRNIPVDLKTQSQKVIQTLNGPSTSMTQKQIQKVIKSFPVSEKCSSENEIFKDSTTEKDLKQKDEDGPIVPKKQKKSHKVIKISQTSEHSSFKTETSKNTIIDKLEVSCKSKNQETLNGHKDTKTPKTQSQKVILNSQTLNGPPTSITQNQIQNVAKNPQYFTKFSIKEEINGNSSTGEDLKLNTDDSKSQDSQNLKEKPIESSTGLNFECLTCYKRFATKLKLYYHSRTHQPKTECQICGKKVQKYLIHRHLRYHHDNKPFKCDLCPMSFINVVSIRNHMYRHMTTKKLYCDQCERGYNDSRHLREHKISHTILAAFRCDMCPKRYPRKQALEAHIQGIHMSESKVYECKICGYKTRTMTVLYSHSKRHNKTHPCEFCGRNFANSLELQDHRLAIHIKVKSFECKVCGKFFVSHRYVLKHMRRTHCEYEIPKGIKILNYFL